MPTQCKYQINKKSNKKSANLAVKRLELGTTIKVHDHH